MTNSVVAVFCEFIRQEASGTETLIGILPDNVSVPVFPVQLPSLALYVRFHQDSAFATDTLSYSLIAPDDATLASETIDPLLVKKALSDSKRNGSPVVGIISRVSFVGLTVPKEGRLIVKAKIGSQEFIAGSLYFSTNNALP